MPGSAKKPGRDSVFSEPAFTENRDACAGTDQEVWEEPTLQTPPPLDGSTFRDALRKRWERTSEETRLAAFIGLLAISGALGIGCAIFNEALLNSKMLGAQVFTPAIEELCKVIGIMLALELRPWLFSRASSIVFLAAVSGFAFAALENILYLCIYIPDPSIGIIAWRWTVCVALHVGCSAIAGAGLAREWRNAAARKGRGATGDALPCLIAAMAIHGLYNLAASFL